MIPIILGGIGLFGTLDYERGKIDQRFKPIEEYVQSHTTEKLFEMMVSRAEWQQQVVGRDKEMIALHDRLGAIDNRIQSMDNKIDHLILELDGRTK